MSTPAGPLTDVGESSANISAPTDAVLEPMPSLQEKLAAPVTFSRRSPSAAPAPSADQAPAEILAGTDDIPEYELGGGGPSFDADNLAPSAQGAIARLVSADKGGTGDGNADEQSKAAKGGTQSAKKKRVKRKRVVEHQGVHGDMLLGELRNNFSGLVDESDSDEAYAGPVVERDWEAEIMQRRDKKRAKEAKWQRDAEDRWEREDAMRGLGSMNRVAKQQLDAMEMRRMNVHKDTLKMLREQRVSVPTVGTGASTGKRGGRIDVLGLIRKRKAAIAIPSGAQVERMTRGSVLEQMEAEAAMADEQHAQHRRTYGGGRGEDADDDDDDDNDEDGEDMAAIDEREEEQGDKKEENAEEPAARASAAAENNAADDAAGSADDDDDSLAEVAEGMAVAVSMAAAKSSATPVTDSEAQQAEPAAAEMMLPPTQAIDVDDEEPTLQLDILAPPAVRTYSRKTPIGAPAPRPVAAATPAASAAGSASAASSSAAAEQADEDSEEAEDEEMPVDDEHSSGAAVLAASGALHSGGADADDAAARSAGGSSEDEGEEAKQLRESAARRAYLLERRVNMQEQSMDRLVTLDESSQSLLGMIHCTNQRGTNGGALLRSSSSVAGGDGARTSRFSSLLRGSSGVAQAPGGSAADVSATGKVAVNNMRAALSRSSSQHMLLMSSDPAAMIAKGGGESSSQFANFGFTSRNPERLKKLQRTRTAGSGARAPGFVFSQDSQDSLMARELTNGASSNHGVKRRATTTAAGNNSSQGESSLFAKLKESRF